MIQQGNTNFVQSNMEVSFFRDRLLSVTVNLAAVAFITRSYGCRMSYGWEACPPAFNTTSKLPDIATISCSSFFMSMTTPFCSARDIIEIVKSLYLKWDLIAGLDEG